MQAGRQPAGTPLPGNRVLVLPPVADGAVEGSVVSEEVAAGEVGEVTLTQNTQSGRHPAGSFRAPLEH